MRTSKIVLLVLALTSILLLFSSCSADRSHTPDTTGAPVTATETQSEIEETDITTESIVPSETVLPGGIADSWDGTSAAIPDEQQTNPTASADSTKPTTAPDIFPPEDCTFEQFSAMDGAQQQAFCDSFASLADFKAWYKAAKAAYDQTKPPEVTGDGNIDIGDYLPN